MWKICTKCKKHKALWEFWKVGSYAKRSFSVGSWCKVCEAKKQKENRQNNPRILTKKQKLFRRQSQKSFQTKPAEYNLYGLKLTIDEQPRCAKDEVSLEVKCKYCRNYFIPTTVRVSNRLNALNSIGRSERWLFCSKNCSKKCLSGNKKISIAKDLTEYKKLYKNSSAIYTNTHYKLTKEESPKLAKDGNSLKVKCRFCRNYFIPTKQQVYHRVYALENIGQGEHSLYCSEECKLACPIYASHGAIPTKSLREFIPQELREEIIKRANGICEMCGENKITDLHHEKAVSTHPHLQLDKDNLWGLCEDCHYNVAHQLYGCTLPELKKKSVNNCRTENKILDKT